LATIFASNPITKGHSWTITSKLGHILRTAESVYGERDKTYTILGIELTTNGEPGIWYPGDCKDLVIQITSNCENDLNRAAFQVAHEAIHCLCPTGGRNANFLEEGLATHFSIEYTRDNGHGNWTPSVPKYSEALQFVEHLLSIDSNIIKTLRQIEPTLSLITRELLIATNQNIPPDLADNLTIKF
jgi:hypothetical protein